MEDLEKTRDAITQIDEQMAELFEQRMKLASDVATYKKKNGMPIFDSERENIILNRNLDFIKNAEFKPYYLQFIQSTMDVSKRYQHKLLEGERIAYSGIEGAFANIAARKIFPDGNLISYTDFKSAYDAVEKGECDFAVLPIENSIAGEIAQVSDLMFSGKLFINGVYSFPVTQNLLGAKGANISDIKTVISHPQALEQCADFIRSHGWETISVSNTARGAKEVAQKNDKTVAAIASFENAELYGLTVIDHDINDSSANTTRFAVFSKVRDEKAFQKYSTFIIMFVVKNESGSLAKAINIIADNGYNMRVLRSRPLKDSQWEYYFYAEVEGKLCGALGEKMIKELNEKCQSVKIVGSFSPEN